MAAFQLLIIWVGLSTGVIIYALYNGIPLKDRADRIFSFGVALLIVYVLMFSDYASTKYVPLDLITAVSLGK